MVVWRQAKMTFFMSFNVYFISDKFYLYIKFFMVLVNSNNPVLIIYTKIYILRNVFYI